MPVCTNCKNNYHPEEKTCPICNTKNPSPRRSMSTGKGASKTAEFITGLIIFALLWGGYSFMFGGDDEDSASPPTRQEIIEKQFSAWDGSHRNLERTIKAAMNDPDSYEHVETRFRDDGDSIFLSTTYRGKNAFGGVVTGRVTARSDIDGNIIEVLTEE